MIAIAEKRLNKAKVRIRLSDRFALPIDLTLRELFVGLLLAFQKITRPTRKIARTRRLTQILV